MSIFHLLTDRFSKLPVRDEEPLTHYIFVDEHINKTTHKAKHQLFKPRKNKGNDLSTFRIINCVESYIWYLSKRYVEPFSKKKTIARADFPLAAAKKAQLKINPDGNPHKRHLNLENWPTDSSACKLISMEIANASNLILKNE
ncbi:MAG: hypothetical protein A2Z20_03440 [Bdellovibrionales bacterium RBG_16_40_8]|nr:MAG: hypothetical protein A2Z20_03440 [Bdellovibrionales bacterium RBG_16_40_8]